VAEHEIVSRQLTSSVGYIRVPTLGAEFDATLNGMLDAPGLILDVRGTVAGTPLTATEWRGVC